MHKIIFVSIILLIGLFSLQMGTRSSLRPYYGTSLPTAAKEVQVQGVHSEDWRKSYEVVQDSSGIYKLRERTDLIAL